METISMNTKNSKTNEPHKLPLLKQTCFSSKFMHLLQLEEYETILQKQ